MILAHVGPGRQRMRRPPIRNGRPNNYVAEPMHVDDLSRDIRANFVYEAMGVHLR
jgi:hypothetical protein